ncbi:hypothetical protein BKA18_002543 [Streptomyces auratus]
MPVLPSCLLEPLWDQFAALLPEHVDTHPLGCHNPRIPDRVVFEHVIAALVHGSGYERIASPGCSDRTIRRRVSYWVQLGMAEQIHALALEAYDRVIGLELGELSVDGCITKAPCGGEAAGCSPVDRGKQGLKRSVATEATGVPLGIVAAGANRHDSPLLVPTLETVKGQVGQLPDRVDVDLDRGYDSDKTRCTSPSWASPARSPEKASQRQSRPAGDGWWSAAEGDGERRRWAGPKLSALPGAGQSAGRARTSARWRRRGRRPCGRSPIGGRP